MRGRSSSAGNFVSNSVVTSLSSPHAGTLAYSGIPALRNPSLRCSRCFKYAALVSLNGTGERLRKVETVTSGLVRLYCANAVRASSSRPLKA